HRLVEGDSQRRLESGDRPVPDAERVGLAVARAEGNRTGRQHSRAAKRRGARQPAILAAEISDQAEDPLGRGVDVGGQGEVGHRGPRWWRYRASPRAAESAY